MPEEQTADPGVVIVSRAPGYVRYKSLLDSRQWEIYGYCDQRGDCMIGAVLEDGTIIDSRETLDRLSAERGRLQSDLDVPVTPEFSGCCPLEGRWI